MKKNAKKTPFEIGEWNVDTMMDSAGSHRTKRRSVLIRRDLDRYRIGTAVLSETRLQEVADIKGVVGFTYILGWTLK